MILDSTQDLACESSHTNQKEFCMQEVGGSIPVRTSFDSFK